MGEPGIPGVLVSLYADNNTDGTPDGPALDTETTDGTGFYQFINLTPASYVVGFAQPTGYEPTPADQGGDDAKDSDADVMTGLSPTVTLASNENNRTIDAGFSSI